MTDERKAIVAAGYDAIASRYLDWSSRASDPARVRMLEEFIARLRPGARVLDLGCGAGIPSTRALATRFRVIGVDLSANQVATARRSVPGATFIQADMATVEFPAGSFDGITAFYAMSHVPREGHLEIFTRIAGWLRPNGLFLAALGAQDSPDWVGEWLGAPMFLQQFRRSREPAAGRGRWLRSPVRRRAGNDRAWRTRALPLGPGPACRRRAR